MATFTPKNGVIANAVPAATANAVSNFVPKSGKLVDQRNFATKVGDLFLNRTMTMGRQLLGANQTANEVDAVNANNGPIEQQIMDLGHQILAEKDPTKRKSLADQQRQLQTKLQTVSEMGKKEATLNPYKVDLNDPNAKLKGYATQGLGVGAELGSYLIPAGKAAAGASFGQKVLTGATNAGKVGLLLGATDPNRRMDTLENAAIDTGTNTATQGIMSFLAGGAITAGTEIVKGAINKAIQGANKITGLTRKDPSLPTNGEDWATYQENTKPGNGPMPTNGTDEIQPDFAVEKAKRGADYSKWESRPAVKAYEKSLTVPSKQWDRLKPDKSFSDLLDWGITDGNDGLRRKAELVTGDTGLLTTIKHDAIGSIQGEIEMPMLMGKASKMVDESPVLFTGSKEASFLRMAGKSDAQVGKKIGYLNAQQALAIADKFKEVGYDMYYNGTNPMSSAANKVEQKAMGQNYIQLAEEITDKLYQVAKEQGTLKKWATPEVAQFLSNEVSPKYSDYVMKAIDSGNVKDVQHAAATWVNVSKLLDWTARSEHSTFGKFGELMLNTVAGAKMAPLKVANTLAQNSSVASKAAGALNKWPGIPAIPELASKQIKPALIANPVSQWQDRFSALRRAK